MRWFTDVVTAGKQTAIANHGVSSLGLHAKEPSFSRRVTLSALRKPHLAPLADF